MKILDEKEVALQCQFIKQYSNATHAEHKEKCYKIWPAPDGKSVMSVGYNKNNKQHYLRFHTTEDGKNKHFADTPHAPLFIQYDHRYVSVYLKNYYY